MFQFITFLSLFLSLSAYSYCELCGSYDLSTGWRQDYIHWDNAEIRSQYVSGNAHSDQIFKDIDSYVISGRVKFIDNGCANYYVRLSGDYGFVQKGEAKEDFHMKSSWIPGGRIHVKTSDPITRHSEMYDFNGAVGYPLTFCDSSLLIVPLLGFSFHRQHISVHPKDHYSSYCSGHYSSSCSGSDCGCKSAMSKGVKYGQKEAKKTTKLASQSSNKRLKKAEFGKLFKKSSSSDDSSFYIDSSSQPFVYDFVSPPFQYGSQKHQTIAEALGVVSPHKSSSYRFTWYGFYLGTDISYALDCEWTLFAELEAHFLDQCHRKRKSWTSVQVVDDYHSKENAYGFNSLVGLTYNLCTSWYGTLITDYKWWQSDHKHDRLQWQSVSIQAGLGSTF